MWGGGGVGGGEGLQVANGPVESKQAKENKEKKAADEGMAPQHLH